MNIDTLIEQWEEKHSSLLNTYSKGNINNEVMQLYRSYMKDILGFITQLKNLKNCGEGIKSEIFDFKVHIESKKPYEYRIEYDPNTNMFLGSGLQEGTPMRIVSDGTDIYECFEDLIILHQAKINYENAKHLGGDLKE